VSTERELPYRWAERLIARGFTDRRTDHQYARPSLGALSDATGVHQTTLKSAITGARNPSVETVRRLMKALGDDVAGWLGQDRVVEWIPPAEASLLTDRQRKAVEEIIRAMTERREDVGNDDRSAATKRAPESGADVMQLPSAQALDPTMPDDVAARSETGKGQSQRARERQDKETEGHER
jgi:transcriptional regulator with XRE-family HTH domain